MAQKESEWPRVKREKEVCFQTPDGLFRTDRDMAGPLRFGTAPGCGPRGNRVVGEGQNSDMGMDRLDRPPKDKMGVKYPETDPPGRLISETARRQRGY